MSEKPTISRDQLLEKIADLIHQEWVSWSQTLVAKEHSITRGRRERWAKLWVSYSELPEEQKERDREWARKVFEEIRKYQTVWFEQPK